MFSSQAARMLQQLTAAGMDRRQAEVLLNVLGNCAADLTHRGTIRVDSDWRIDPPDQSWPISLSLQSGSGGAPHGECDNCASGTTPSALLLTLGGTINNDLTLCDDCASILGLYVLEQDADDPCTYSYSGSGPCEGVDEMTIEVVFATTISGTLSFDGNIQATFSKVYSGTLDCSASHDLSVSQASGVWCGWNDVTANIVASNLSVAGLSGGLTKDNYDDFFAVLSAANWEGEYDCDTKTIRGGLAAKFKGPVYIEKIICPDGSCLDCSAVANMPTTLTPVRLSMGARIAQNDDGDYVLQNRMFTGLMAAVVQEPQWEDSYTFPKADGLLTEITWDEDGNKKIQQTTLNDVYLIAKGEEETSDVLEAQQVSRFVKNVEYDTFVHILSEAYATDVYVFAAGPVGVDIVDVAEPCSGTGVEPSLSIASADLDVGAATLSASATMTEKSYSATSALSVGAATLSGSGTSSQKVYGATSALTTGAATLSASATFTEPVYTAEAELEAPAATLSAAGESRGIDCEHCDTGTTPVTVSVQFDNTITGGTCDQEDCQEIVNGGPYLLEQSDTNPCEYQGTFATDCGTFFITFSFLELSKQISIGLGGVSTDHIWTVSANAPYDGMESVIFLPQADGLVNVCDWSAIEATVTIPGE